MLSLWHLLYDPHLFHTWYDMLFYYLCYLYLGIVFSELSVIVLKYPLTHSYVLTHTHCDNNTLQEAFSDVIAYLVCLCPSFSFAQRKREALCTDGTSNSALTHDSIDTAVFVDRTMFVHELHDQIKSLFEPHRFTRYLLRFFGPIDANDEKKRNSNNEYSSYVFHPLQPFDSVALRHMCVVHERFPLFFERVCRMYRVCTQLCTDYR